MKDTVRKQKSGDQLAVGDWLAPGEMLDGAAEVLYVHSWPASADRSLDNVGKHVRLVVREQGSTPDYSDVVSGSALFDLASDKELAALRERADRAKKIADLRALASWFEAHPEMPIPYHFRCQTHGLTGDDVPRVRELAASVGANVETDDNQTFFEVNLGRACYTVIAWHKDGRPAEPAPEPVRELLAIAPSADGGVAFALAPAGAVTDPVARAKVVELTEAVAADPTGLAYSRADGEPDDPTPVSGARVAPHVGAVTEEGLVDETPKCYVPNGFQAPEVVAERRADCRASHPGRDCRCVTPGCPSEPGHTGDCNVPPDAS